MQMNLIY